MKKSLKVLTLSFLSFVFSVSLATVPAFAKTPNRYETPEEICKLIGEGCSVSGEEINLSSSDLIELNGPETGVYFYPSKLTINLYSPLKINTYVGIVGDIVINDLTDSPEPALIADDEELGLVFGAGGNITLNNLSASVSDGLILFAFDSDSKVEVNGGNFKGGAIFALNSNQELTINGGTFEAKNSVIAID